MQQSDHSKRKFGTNIRKIVRSVYYPFDFLPAPASSIHHCCRPLVNIRKIHSAEFENLRISLHPRPGSPAGRLEPADPVTALSRSLVSWVRGCGRLFVPGSEDGADGLQPGDPPGGPACRHLLHYLHHLAGVGEAGAGGEAGGAEGGVDNLSSAPLIQYSKADHIT